MVDNFSEKQIVVTGSSSFDLTGEIEESITGRKIDFILFPFSLEEISQIYSPLEIKKTSSEIFSVWNVSRSGVKT